MDFDDRDSGVSSGKTKIPLKQSYAEEVTPRPVR